MTEKFDFREPRENTNIVVLELETYNFMLSEREHLIDERMTNQRLSTELYVLKQENESLKKRIDNLLRNLSDYDEITLELEKLKKKNKELKKRAKECKKV